MRRAVVLAASLVLAACASIPIEVAPEGYLNPDNPPNIRLPYFADPVDPPPMSDDRRWLAMAHMEVRPGLAAGNFDCPLGARLSRARIPTLTRIFTRLRSDVDMLGRRFALAPMDGSAKPCIRQFGPSSETWPGRSAALNAAYSEVLATLAPDRADQLREAGLRMAESTALCGFIPYSEAPILASVGGSIASWAMKAPDAQADLLQARAEIDAVRASGLTSPACAAERRALSN